MKWEVEYTDEFGAWWNALSENMQEALDTSVRLLEEKVTIDGTKSIFRWLTGSTTTIWINFEMKG